MDLSWCKKLKSYKLSRKTCAYGRSKLLLTTPSTFPIASIFTFSSFKRCNGSLICTLFCDYYVFLYGFTSVFAKFNQFVLYRNSLSVLWSTLMCKKHVRITSRVKMDTSRYFSSYHKRPCNMWNFKTINPFIIGVLFLLRSSKIISNTTNRDFNSEIVSFLNAGIRDWRTNNPEMKAKLQSSDITSLTRYIGSAPVKCLLFTRDSSYSCTAS